MNQKFLPKSTHEFLVRHLIEVENEKEVVLKEFYPRVSIESIQFEKIIGNYISSIEEYVKYAQVVEGKAGQIPFVLIGSAVDIQDLFDQTVETVHIVSPFINQGQVNYTFASYLSPLGRELLLKKRGDRVDIKLPVGHSRYLVNDIRLEQ